MQLINNIIHDVSMFPPLQSRAHELLPFLVLGTVGVLAALISVNLPETAGEQVGLPFQLFLFPEKGALSACIGSSQI